MATLRAVKKRIEAVKSTQQITKAMQMVAAARLKRSQANLSNSLFYLTGASSILEHIKAGAFGILEKNPFFQERDSGLLEILLITSDRGLCGAFNQNIFKKFESFTKDIKKDDLFINVVGKKGCDYIRKREYMAVFEPETYRKDTLDLAKAVVSRIVKKFLDKETKEVYVIYTKFISTIKHEVVVEKILPLEKDIKEEIEFIFEPGPEDIINTFLPIYLEAKVCVYILNSQTSEYAARMTAMDNATNNAQELIRHLTIQYNKARQESITKELMDIVGGAEALK